MNNLGFTNIYTRIMGMAISHNNSNNSASSASSSASSPTGTPGTGARNSSTATGTSSSLEKKSASQKKHETPVMDFVEDLDDDGSEDERRYHTKNRKTNGLRKNQHQQQETDGKDNLLPPLLSLSLCLTRDVSNRMQRR
jgi:hypothetical protein